jgi:hypothetical protein
MDRRGKESLPQKESFGQHLNATDLILIPKKKKENGITKKCHKDICYSPNSFHSHNCFF